MKQIATPHEILKTYWGFDEFRPLQLDIVQSALDGRDTLALLPTGGGKSICFQVPALCQEGICVVISPLIALMKDQVQNLVRRRISAVAIFSGMSASDIDRTLDNCIHGQIKFLYISPERLQTEIAQERLKRMNINLLAIDEAHCISQWGYDFRPSYLRIAEMRTWLPKPVPMLALTATATAEVVEDIQAKLGFKPETSRVFQKSFVRDNLAYVVLREENKYAKLLEILQKMRGSGVVYVQNRRETKEIAQFLQQNKISADFYHAGLTPEQRSTIQDKWIKNEIRIIVSTNAFGMGIDKPDVRVVVHLTLPDSLEAYFQEAGRAGRDGNQAYAVLLYSGLDRQRLERQLELAFPALKDVRKVYQALGSYYQLAIGAALGESFDFELAEFCKRYNLEPIPTLNALKLLAQEGYLELSEAVFIPSTLQVIVSRERLYDYALRQPKLDRLLKAILRAYQGASNHEVAIKEKQLAGQTGLSLPELEAALLRLKQDEIIRYTPQRDAPQLTFLTERLYENDIIFNKERYDFLRTRAEARTQAAIHYAETLRCRNQLLLEYFDEKEPKPCGKCDVCTGAHDDSLTSADMERFTQQLRGVLQQGGRQLHELVALFPTNQRAKLAKAIEYFLDNEFINRSKDGRLWWVSR